MKTSNRAKRKSRIKTRIRGNGERPRLSVYRSNKHIYAQIIDDEKGITLASASDLKLTGAKEKKGVEIASMVGEEIGKKAKEKKVKHVVLDRNGYKYHGSIKSLADSARKSGLLF